MTSPKLAILQRQMERRTPERIPAPADDLTAAIQQLIDQRVDQAMEEQPAPAHVQRMLDRQFNKPAHMPTDYRELPAVAKTPAPKMREIQFQRDELGRVVTVSCGTLEFHVQRNPLGKIVRMVPSDIAPPPTAIEPPFKAEAREYNPGVPR
jgi:hypothetical protein